MRPTAPPRQPDAREDLDERLGCLVRILSGIRLELRRPGRHPDIEDVLAIADECLAAARRRIAIDIATTPPQSSED